MAGSEEARSADGWLRTEEKLASEVEVTDSGSRGAGSVARVDTETLQNCHQSRLGESSGESPTEASRNGSERETGGGAQELPADGGRAPSGH